MGQHARLTLVRHASTGTGHVLFSRTDNPLSRQGIEEAKNCAQMLQGLGIDGIFSSPMKRCLQTAEIISRKLGVSVIVEERLKEVDFGIFEGKTVEEAKKDHPEKWEERQKNKWMSRIEGGESYKDAWERVDGFVSDIQSGSLGNNVLAVTHGTLIKVMLYKILGKSLKEIESEYVRPASCFLIDFKTRHPKLKKITTNKQ